MRWLPQTTGRFVWTQESWGAALRCEALAEVADHVFTSRQLPLTGRADADNPEWRSLAASLAVAPADLVRVRQMHGRNVFEIRRDSSRSSAEAEADIIMSDDPALALVVRVADCVPLLVADARTGAVAAVHAGWRGTAAGAAAAAVDELARRFGSRPEHLVAAIGPSIGPCCYEVGEDVRLACVAGFGAAAGRWFVTGPRGRIHFDLWGATRAQLEGTGVPADRIHLAGLCTATHRRLFFSYRAEGAGTGRLVAAIRPADRRTASGN